jgi:hypothetical protein
MNININGSTPSGDFIKDFAAGQEFLFETSSKGNNGLCVRVKDSKSGKARFLNLENGKLLTASASDTGRPVEAEIEVYF